MNRAPGLGDLTGRQAFLLTTLVWSALALFAALPFAFCELQLGPADAVFEAMSGITTTGATVIAGLDAAPPGILLWRAILQWLGGIGIIVMGIAILPMLSIGGMQLLRAESSDLSEKILPRAAQLASAIGLIYLGLTLVCAILYWYAGMLPFDAAAHAMTTIATGGYSTSDASIGGFQSPAIEWIAVVFMVLGGLPFVLYIQATNGHVMALFRDAQVRWFLGIIATASLGIALWLALTSQIAPLDALRHACFNTISLITGTGFASTDYGLWGTFPVAALFFLMCIGGCTGSTTGGIKVFRFTVMHAIAKNQVARLVRPHGVFLPTFNGRPLPDAAAISVMAFVFMFGLSFAVIAMALSLARARLRHRDVGRGHGTRQCRPGPGRHHRAERQFLEPADQRQVAALGRHAARPARAVHRADPVHAGLLARLSVQPGAAYQLPVFAIEAQGSRGGSASPFCSSSIEMPSGDLTNAMRPSRGGRLMVTPPSIRRWQVA